MGFCPKVGAKLLLFYQIDNFFTKYVQFIVKKKSFWAKNRHISLCYRLF